MKVEERNVHHMKVIAQNSELKFQMLPKHHPL
jgi:hypothetical protein